LVFKRNTEESKNTDLPAFRDLQNFLKVPALPERGVFPCKKVLFSRAMIFFLTNDTEKI